MSKSAQCNFYFIFNSIYIFYRVLACINIYGEITFHSVSEYYKSPQKGSSARANPARQNSIVPKSKQPSSDFDLQFPKANEPDSIAISSRIISEPNGILLDGAEDHPNKWQHRKELAESLAGLGEKKDSKKMGDFPSQKVGGKGRGSSSARSKNVSPVLSKPLPFDRKCAWDIQWASVSIICFQFLKLKKIVVAMNSLLVVIKSAKIVKLLANIGQQR